MATNTSWVDDRVLKTNILLIILQVLIMTFLYINSLLIIIFFKKECFHTTARYILFALTLLSDSLCLFVTNVLVIFVHFNITIPVWLCIIIHVPVLLYVTVTPVTLTAMTLERYVAICMPLRHGELCSTRSTMHCILIIHSLSSIPCIILSALYASVSVSFYKQYQICYTSMFISQMREWQNSLRSAIYQIQFLIMFIIIVFSYIKILNVAKAASGEKKSLSRNGLRTVVLHGFQLLLCLIQLWCPFIEAAFQNSSVYRDLNYSNYILFYVAPKCLNPLIYGIRDESYFNALKTYASCGLYKRNNV